MDSCVFDLIIVSVLRQPEIGLSSDSPRSSRYISSQLQAQTLNSGSSRAGHNANSDILSEIGQTLTLFNEQISILYWFSDPPHSFPLSDFFALKALIYANSGYQGLLHKGCWDD